MGKFATKEQLVDHSANYLWKYDSINMEMCLILYISIWISIFYTNLE